MDEFIGPWTPEEKEIINRVLVLHDGQNTTNPWRFYKHGSKFSAKRQAWDSGGLYCQTIEELSAELQLYYSR